KNVAFAECLPSLGVVITRPPAQSRRPPRLGGETMRRRYSRTAAVVLALLAGGLAAFALRPTAGTSTTAVAARNPAVEVRTQVIRRTIHVIRHEPGARLRGSRTAPSVVVRPHGRVTTGA